MGELFTYDDRRNKFLRPNVPTVKKGQGSLRRFGPVIWNEMLPDRVKSSPNRNIFKDRIKSWIPKWKCRLCGDHTNNCKCYLCGE